MDPLTSAAASGLRARLEALDMLANNIANSSTAGYKRDGEFYGIFQGELQAAAGETQMPVIEKNWTDLSQGTMQITGNSLDFALSGPGWFAVNAPGGTLYTRNGSFHVDNTGTVTTLEGYPIRLVGGANLRIRPGAPLVAGSDGSLTQGGQPLGKLETAGFTDGELARNGANFFRPVGAAKPAALPVRTEILQAKLENANVSAAESAVRLISLTRQFESLQKAIVIGAEMNRRSLDDLAKV